MRKGDKLKNIEQANLMIEQSYLKSKGVLNETEIIEEGWKEWLIGGILTLSALGGFYKLNEKSVENEKVKTEYANGVNKIIDKMTDKDLIDLAKKYNEIGVTTIGTDTQDNVDIPGNSLFTKLQDKSQLESPSLEGLKKDIESKVKENPEWFLVKKDGTTVTLNPNLKK
jgi:hypothetical protein